MTWRIGVGIQPDSSYSAQVLSQLGVGAKPVESIADGVAEGVRVFLWNKSGVMTEEALSGERVAIITDHACHRSNVSVGVEPVCASYYFRLEHKPFSAQSFYVNLPVFQVAGKTFGACYDRSNNRMPNSGIGIIEGRNRLIISVPWNVCGYQQGVEWKHRAYFSPVARKHFVEVGPLLDTGAFRRLLLEILLYCFNWVGLPLVRVSPFYRNKRFFSFRVDADGFTESSTKAALRIAEKTGLRFTWFIDAVAWRHEREWFSLLKEHDQDVQLHCFRHMTYVSQEVNEINIRKGLKVLQKHGVIPNAIVSPLGYNYRGFSDAIKAHGFVYSSEFGYAVHDLPSNPWNDKNYPLQIPVHPGCSGRFREAGFTEQEQFDHLLEHVRRRCEFDGICILYDHPINGMEAHESQFITFFNLLRDSQYEYICMSDYYLAWIERHENPIILYDQGRIQVDGFRDNGFRLEQVTNGPTRSVRWENTTLPQVSLPERTDEFCYPPEWIRYLAHKNGLLHLKQRNFSMFEWHVNEVCHTLGRKTGCFVFRRLLARLKWLRALREKMRYRG